MYNSTSKGYIFGQNVPGFDGVIMQMEGMWHHVAISVRDMDKVLNFYCDLLGFQIDWERENYAGEDFAGVLGLAEANARVVMLKGYNTRLELFKFYAPICKDTGPKHICDFGLTHFAITVRNIHDIYHTLSRAGVQFNCPPRKLRPGVQATYMKDPEGVTVELVEYE